MRLHYYYALLLLSLFFIVCPFSATERVAYVEGPPEDSCSVVNVYVGTNRRKEGPSRRDPPRQPGDNLQDDRDDDFQAIVTNMINAESCWDLLQTGIKQSGYYLMKSNSVNHEKAIYQYCDLTPYEDVSSCGELVESRNISEYGYYRFRDRSGQLGFHYCPDPYTCEQLSRRDGIDTSGLYRVGPPGSEFEVYCNFFSGQAVTEVLHDQMQEKLTASSCSNQGCFTLTPGYQISLSNIIRVIENSRECRQYIKMRCQGSVLLYKPNPYSWWVSRGGEKMLYWGGAVSKRRYYCACGETRSCVDNNYYCNCDNNAVAVSTQDEGYLTDKSKLPVREMKFGDLDDSGEKSWHTLGKLECTGQA